MDAVRTLDTFFENTCVIVVFAYLLTRGRLMTLLFRAHPSLWEVARLGAVFGLMGLVELFFSRQRFPYDTYTLIVTFAAVNNGLRVGVVTATIVTLGAFLFQSPDQILRTGASVFLAALIGATVWQIMRGQLRLISGLVAVLLAEVGAILLRLWLAGPEPAAFSLSLAVARVAANGFGVLLLELVVNDARARLENEQYRAELERSRALVAEAQLTALRARIHPHFLFNTLTSIAGLCGVAPDKAEDTIVQLSQIMRRAIEADPATLIPLRDEWAHTRDYVEIERLRLASRLNVCWNIEARCETVLIPPFSIQTLVENAINHGIAPKTEPGHVTITARQGRNRILIAVQDDGVGMTESVRRQALLPQESDRLHGLPILTQQLTLLYGRAARLRLFSQPERGTCVVFGIPGEQSWQPR